ncbi:MAG: hypothetical protein K2G93_01835 [Rikenella sp.]|nr:hypothetical protein [Rikenella sp.]
MRRIFKRLSKTTDYLVYDFDLDPKLSAEAERFGVRVLSEEQFRRLIHSQS